MHRIDCCCRDCLQFVGTVVRSRFGRGAVAVDIVVQRLPVAELVEFPKAIVGGPRLVVRFQTVQAVVLVGLVEGAGTRDRAV